MPSDLEVMCACLIVVISLQSLVFLDAPEELGFVNQRDRDGFKQIDCTNP